MEEETYQAGSDGADPALPRYGFRVISQFLKDLSFENVNPPAELHHPEEVPPGTRRRAHGREFLAARGHVSHSGSLSRATRAAWAASSTTLGACGRGVRKRRTASIAISRTPGAAARSKPAWRPPISSR